MALDDKKAKESSFPSLHTPSVSGLQIPMFYPFSCGKENA